MRRRASELLGEGRPAVLGVPDDEGGENRQSDAEPGQQRRRGEPATQRRRGGQGQADPGGEKDCGELRFQRQAERQPKRDQPARVAGQPKLDESRKPEGPEHHQRRVGGDEDRPDEDQRHPDPKQRRERGLFRRAEQTPCDQSDEGRHRADDEEGKRPHADFGPPEQRRRGPDEEGDHRRMVEVSKRKRSRPQRVIGFVEGKLEPPGDEGLRGQERNRRRDGAKAEPTGALRSCSGPRGGGEGRIAAHLVAFAFSVSRPLRQSVARKRASRQSSRRPWRLSRIGKMTRRCGATHTGASPSTSYKPLSAARKAGGAAGFGVMAITAYRKELERRGSRRRGRRLAIFLSHRLPPAGGRRAGRGGAAPARSLRDVLDRRRPRFDRRGARRRARVFRSLHAALRGSSLSRPAGGIGLGGAIGAVDALPGRSRAAPVEDKRVARGDAAGGGCAAGKRERDRPLSVSDRRGRRHGDHSRAIPRRDPERSAGRWPARGRRGRDRGASLSGDRRARGSRTQRSCAAAFDCRAVLRLYRQLRAACDRHVRRLPGAVVRDLRPQTDSARIGLGRRRAYPVVAAHPGARAHNLSVDFPRSAHIAAGALSVASPWRRTCSPTTS